MGNDGFKEIRIRGIQGTHQSLGEPISQIPRFAAGEGIETVTQSGGPPETFNNDLAWGLTPTSLVERLTRYRPWRL
jgi:hypothetical protein